jgi:hypothetical protein
VSLDDAHDLILADEQMRRLVALRDIRYKGRGSSFVRDGDRIKFR